MVQERYAVEVTKDFLVFSAAHFITFAGDQCERLHGHNYRVAVEVEDELDENGYVFDFIAIRDQIHAIVLRLDHHVLLPAQSERILVSAGEKTVTARYQDRQWSFPADDCVLLPVSNTTAELLARWIGMQWHEGLMAAGHTLPRLTRVRVEENFGQWGIWEYSRVVDTPQEKQNGA